MSMVYGLLKQRIKYVGDDKDSKEGEEKMDKILINYCGMLVCFGLKEFSIVTDLRYDRLEECFIKETPHKRSNKRKGKEDGLLGIVGHRFKVRNLIADLKDKNIPKQYKEKLYLVWFTHSVILAWAFEVILPLRKQFKDYPDEVSHARIIRWLVAKSSKIFKKVDLFNPMDDTVVHPWIIPTEQELGMNSFIKLGLVDTTKERMVELIKKELDGATTIRREVRQGHPNVEAHHDQPTVTDPDVLSGGVTSGVIDDGGSHPDASATASRDYEHIGAQERINTFENTPCIGPSHPSSPSCSHCKCKVLQGQRG
ncbi:hypothetical protein FXO37_31467 [Capsicum annuum]|nr:hypothetical protein FXO37_31467 [Capsicum annuum]